MLCLIILLKNMILDIFYNGLTDASRDYLDSCVGSLFRERTPDEAEILLNNMLTNENNWALPEPAPTPMSGDIGLHEHLWGRSPLSVRRGAEVAQRADRGDTHTHTTILPSFGPHGCVKPYCCLSG